MIRTIIILSLFLTTAVLAQDGASQDEAVSETGDDPVESSTDDAQDDSLDDDLEDDILSGNQDHTEDDDDIFVPTDEISFQQSIPFPTDI